MKTSLRTPHSAFRTSLASLALCVFALNVSAQTNNVITNQPPSVLPPATNSAPTISGGLTEIYDAIESSGLTTATNYAFEPYLTYAPDAPSGNRIGGGILAVYNVSTMIGAGLEVDYLGQFSLVSANVTLKVPTHPFSFIGSGWATNLVVAPFALAGVGTALSGTSSGAIAVTDAGAYVQFGELWGGKFNVGAAYGQWSNAGQYSGERYHFFVGWSKGF